LLLQATNLVAELVAETSPTVLRGNKIRPSTLSEHRYLYWSLLGLPYRRFSDVFATNVVAEISVVILSPSTMQFRPRRSRCSDSRAASRRDGPLSSHQTASDLHLRSMSVVKRNAPLAYVLSVHGVRALTLVMTR